MDNTDTNECCICMSEIMDSIYLHETCGNKYCDGCFGSIKEAAKKGIMKCACCTNQIEESQLKITKLDGDKEIECEYCHDTLKTKNYDSHIEECEEYKKKIEADIQKNKFKEVKPTINRSTFKCPFCEEKNLDRKDLITHVSSNHRKQPAVCPICAVQEYGDPNYVSRDLSGHLKLRHKYDLDTYTNYELNDDAILAQVLAKSMMDC